MTYVMTKPCPVCKQQLTKQKPTDTVQCGCGKHVWQGEEIRRGHCLLVQPRLCSVVAAG